MLYQIVVFLHVITVFGYLLAHGVSAAVAFALKKERDISKIKTLLELSGNSYPLMFQTLYASIIFGIIAGFQGSWWGAGWIWTSIVLVVIIFVLMGIFGGTVYSDARKAAGLPYSIRGKQFPAESPASDEELYALLAKSNPILVSIIGYGGYALIAWLMITKPF